MPSTSKKQHDFMAFKAHDKSAPNKLQQAAKHYLAADKKQGKYQKTRKK